MSSDRKIEAEEAGQDARQAGTAQYDNPHTGSGDSDLRQAWDKGWVNGQG
jgi:hypothetical protein